MALNYVLGAVQLLAASRPGRPDFIPYTRPAVQRPVKPEPIRKAA